MDLYIQKVCDRYIYAGGVWEKYVALPRTIYSSKSTTFFLRFRIKENNKIYVKFWGKWYRTAW